MEPLPHSESLPLPTRTSAQSRLHLSFVRLVGAVGLLVGVGCGSGGDHQPEPVEHQAETDGLVRASSPRAPGWTSLASLVVAPQEFDGRVVLVRGVYVYDGNHCCQLYLTSEHAAHGALENAVAVVVPSSVAEDERRELSGQWIQVSGVFHATTRGMLPGRLDEVGLLQPVEPNAGQLRPLFDTSDQLRQLASPAQP